MAGIGIIVDAAEARAGIESILRAVERPRGLMDALGGYFVFSTQRRFETETAPDGSAWPRLSPRTANKRIGRKGRRGYEHILRLSGRLYQSITYEAADDSVEWGTNVVYGRIQQLGGTIDMPERQGTVTLKRVKRKGGVRSRFARVGTNGAESQSVRIGAHRITIPARPYLGLSSVDQQRISEIAADYLRREAGQ
jgi:phage virion morphogenesis protein